MNALSIESVPQVAHLVQDTAKGPHITLITIGLCFEEFRRHVVWRTDAGVREIFSIVEHSGDTEITESNL